MAVSAEFLSYVTDLFAPFGDIKFKRFFSGAGIYFKDKMLGFIIRERIYLKTNDQTRPDFEAEGAAPFTFTNHKGEVVSIAYWEVPSRLLDDPDELTAWARRAYDVAIATTGNNKKSRAKKQSSKSSPPSDLPLVEPRKARKKPAR